MIAVVARNPLSIRVRQEVDEAKELVKTVSLVSQKGGDLTPRGILSSRVADWLTLMLQTSIDHFHCHRMSKHTPPFPHPLTISLLLSLHVPIS